jgi:cell division GTPase FtsZ
MNHSDFQEFVYEITEIFASFKDGDIPIDIFDIETVLSYKGVVYRGKAISSSIDVISMAIKDAFDRAKSIKQPLHQIKSILIHFTIPNSYTDTKLLSMIEPIEREISYETPLIFGVSKDDELSKESVGVMVLFVV